MGDIVCSDYQKNLQFLFSMKSKWRPQVLKSEKKEQQGDLHEQTRDNLIVGMFNIWALITVPDRRAVAVLALVLFPTRLTACKGIKLHSRGLCLCDGSPKGAAVAGSRRDMIIACDCLNNWALSHLTNTYTDITAQRQTVQHHSTVCLKNVIRPFKETEFISSPATSDVCTSHFYVCFIVEPEVFLEKKHRQQSRVNMHYFWNDNRAIKRIYGVSLLGNPPFLQIKFN